MSESDQSTPAAPVATLLRDRVWWAYLVGFAILGLPFFDPEASPEPLRSYSGAVFGPVTLGAAIGLVLWSARALESPRERRFWFLIGSGLSALWLAGGAVAIASQTAGVPWLVMTDVLYLGFYVMMALAALTVPHRPSAGSRQLISIEILSLGFLTLGFLAYFVLVPSGLGSLQYRSWVPSMYLFIVLDLLLVFLFARLLRDAESPRWRALYLGLLVAVVGWGALDLVEVMDYSGWLSLPSIGAVDLLWSLPILVVVAVGRVGRLALAGPALQLEPAAGKSPRLANVALGATVGFPLIHLLMSSFAMLDPELQQPREAVVLASVVGLGLLALLERAQVQRTRWQERDKRETAERALRESEARYRTLVENAPEAIVIFDPESGLFVDGNSRALDLLKVSREELLRSSPAELSPSVQPDGRSSSEAADEAIRRALEGENPSFEWVHRSALGEYLHCEVYLTACPWSGRQVVRGSMIDVTDQLELREQLRQSQRMESIGQLAGGVAHDFNNLLTVISGYCDLALARRELEPGLRRELEEIRSAGTSAANLTSQLLAFSRRQVLKLEPMDLNRAVEGMREMLGRLIGEDVILDFDLGADMRPIQADAGQVEQTILNLAVNARDAMPTGGLLHLQTSMVAVETDEGVSRTFGQLVVSDSGQGMDTATRERVFEPFFTTKTLGHGTGLGLATVYGIVTQSGGSITVDSAPGVGTRFTVRFPLAAAPAATARVAPAEGAPNPRGEESVLLLEDEKGVRELLHTGLESLGYAVVAVADGEEALEVAGDPAQGPFAVLVSDVVLPGSNGPEVADRIRGLCPGIEVIFISGYTDDLLARKGGPRKQEPLLQKPFTAVALGRTIREVLDRPREAPVGLVSDAPPLPPDRSPERRTGH